MRILDWNNLNELERQEALTRPHFEAEEHLLRRARDVIAQVRRDGDAGVRALTQRFDRVWLESFAVTEREFAEARGALNRDQLAALERAIANVQRFHEAQVLKSFALETEAGVRCEELVRPIARIGLYVPGGTAPLPSSVIMLGVPSRLAGCPQRILCTPPQRDGTAHAGVLTAAQLCGIDTVFKVGGAQAIAALGYGTESIPKVGKIFGPGNAYVTAAKQLVSNDPAGAACDLPAGPSEVLVLADETARAEFVIADLLAQAEHDALAQAMLVTVSRRLAEEVSGCLVRQRGELRRQGILAHSLAACRTILVPDLDTGISIVNAYAPEHLILQVHEPRRWLAEIQNAGSVFLGPWSPETLGDYCSGTNHVLPTYGHARAMGGLSLRDFVKTIAVQEVTPTGLRALGPTAITLAELEGLDGHANAVARRLRVLEAVATMESESLKLPAAAVYR
jgi:histidinol dehydrogenase